MSTVNFSEIRAARPEFERVERRYRELETQWSGAASTEDRLQVVLDWDREVRELETWENLTHLHFQQDTQNPQYKAAREYLDELRPKLTRLEVEMKRRILAAEDRNALAERLGEQAFALWNADVAAFDPRIEEDLVQESKLEAKYQELLAAADLQFQGKSYNFAGLTPFHTDPDRDVRYESNRVRWGWFEQNLDELDSIYAELVHLRNAMAEKMGYDDYVGLGYQRMKRVDYDRNDVQRFRAGVREHVVPLGARLRERQARELGIDCVMLWDEGIFESQGNPRPQGDHDWMIEQATDMFDQMGKELGSFFHLMVDGNLMDLKNRDRKAGGGFCTDFPSYGLPYIFANFNGTKGDVEVFTHEIGHAFQGYSSRGQLLRDYLFPTYESCEIHSMGLEYLTWPQMEKFFGGEAERFRRVHLTESLLFLPYGVAVDHFQHLVYENPGASPAEIHAMWRKMEQTYLPWRDAGDLPHVGKGGQWQLQRHIYISPFYYIDYTLALTCALQLWVRSRQDPSATMRDYVALCERGGEAPFQELAKSAGLTSPFEPDCLQTVVEQARQVLDL